MFNLPWKKTKKISEYSFPAMGFTMKYPQSWSVNKTVMSDNSNHTRLLFSQSENQAFFRVDISSSYETGDGSNVGLGYDVPNSTTLEFMEEIKIAGLKGWKWTFLVNNPDRIYFDKFFHVAQQCPELKNNIIHYFINIEYTKGDENTERTLQTMLDSIEINCPYVN